MNISEFTRDTLYVIRKEYYSAAILDGLTGVETPLFDRIAADYFSCECCSE